MKHLLFSIAVLLTSCGRGHERAGPDADAVDADADMADAGPSSACAAGSLSGDMPFARSIRADLVLRPDHGREGDPRPHVLTGTVWFPAGRAPGAEAVLAFGAGWPYGASTLSVGNVGAGGAASFDVSGFVDDGEVRATVTLAAAGDDLRFEASFWNRAPWVGDVVDPWITEGTLCADGDAPPVTLTFLADSTGMAPHSPVVLLPGGPLDPDRIGVTVTAAGVDGHDGARG